MNPPFKSNCTPIVSETTVGIRLITNRLTLSHHGVNPAVPDCTTVSKLSWQAYDKACLRKPCLSIFLSP